jgi:hypothetical protein
MAGTGDIPGPQQHIGSMRCLPIGQRFSEMPNL